MKYLLQRWKGPMSIACLIQMDEFVSFVKSISPYFGLPITFSVYVPLKPHNSSYFIEGNGKRMVFPSTLYPVNLLRDLAIESIRTTHYLNIDADLFVSSTSPPFFIIRYNRAVPPIQSQCLTRREKRAASPLIQSHE